MKEEQKKERVLEKFSNFFFLLYSASITSLFLQGMNEYLE
jgi:hypothetical protein